jgi:hypothetical protein
MGTTATAIRSGEGVQLCFVLAIEGYERLLTDVANLGAVTTAWVGTDWSLALPGLEVRGAHKQSFEPWGDTIEAPELTFAVQPDEDDTFGIAVWKLKPSFKTRLTALFSPASNGTGTMTVKQTTAAASSGALFYGGRQFKYSAKGGTSFTVSSANHYAPFAGSGGAKYVPPHAVASGEFAQTVANPKVQDCPRTWNGKKVALYLHRIVGGVCDTPAQAQLEFAGRIKRVYEDDRGWTCVECVDLRADIRDCVLHRDQFIGYLKEGIRLTANTKLKALESVSGTFAESTTFTVVTSGASGSSEVNEGIYDIYEIVSRLDKWLQANSATFSSDWSCGILPLGSTGRRLVFTGSRSAAATQKFTIQCNSPHLMQCLGFEPTTATSSGFYSVGGPDAVSATVYNLVSPNAPYRIKSTAHGDHRGQDPESGYVLEIDGHEGEWWDHHAYLPTPYNDWANGENWSLLKIGDQLCWGKYVSDTQLTNVTAETTLSRHASRGYVGYAPAYGLTVDELGEHLEVRQVIALAGSFSEIIPRLLASIAGDGTNHTDYDVFPMGAALPWSLLGDDFLASIRSLEQANRSGGMMLLFDRPTKLVDVLLPELMLRFAWLIFKDGVYQLVSPPTPNALDTDHQLDETNKAGKSLDLRARSEVSEEWLRNVVKVDFNRTLDGDYQRHDIYKHPTSIADYGESQAITIKAANSYADSAGTGTAVEDLAINLVTKVLPFFARPMRIVTRSISPALFHAAPGDTATVQDDFVRDPTHGRRGMSNRAGIIIAVSHDWGAGGGELGGEAVIMFSEEDRTYPMSPCAEVDTTFGGTLDGLVFTNGYASAGPALKLKDHGHSRSSDEKDITHFAVGDLIRPTEFDPADPAAPDAWDRSITAIDSGDGYITLNSTLTSPAWGGATKLYRVVPRLYSVVGANQKLHAFIADDADGLILDEAEPNLYGEFSQSAFSVSSALTLARLIVTESDDEGRPFHPGLLSDLGINLNHLVHYGMSRAVPVAMAAGASIDETATSYKLHTVWPFFIGGEFQAGTTRRLIIAPEMSTTGGTGYARITISRIPPKGSSLTGVTWEGAKYQREFTTTSTTRVVLTPQTLNAIVGGDSGVVFISVELKATTSETTTFYGLAEQTLGPLQSTV